MLGWSSQRIEAKEKRKRKSGYGGQVWLSERVYLLAITVYLLIGIVVTAFMSVLAYNLNLEEMSILTLLGLMFGVGLVIPIVGIFISIGSDNWAISTLGYTLVVVPLGFLMGPTIALYDLSSVLNVAGATMLVTASMFLFGLAYPPILKDYTGGIVAVLFALILVNISYFILPVENVGILYRLIDWGAVILFSGLIFYDVNKAMQRDFTLDNAVDSTVGIYLDVINLFLYLLRLFGGSSSSD